MPIVSIVTNVSTELTQSPNFRKLLFELLAKALKRPEDRIALHVVSDKNFSMGNSDEPTSLVHIKATTSLSPEENIQHSKIISNFLHEKLGVPVEKTLIRFELLNPHDVGFRGTTAAEFFKNNK